MKKMTALIVITIAVLLAGCTKLSVPTASGTAKYQTFEPFRLRNSTLTYDPATGKIDASITRQQAVSPEMVQAISQAALATAAAAAK